MHFFAGVLTFRFNLKNESEFYDLPKNGVHFPFTNCGRHFDLYKFQFFWPKDLLGIVINSWWNFQITMKIINQLNSLQENRNFSLLGPFHQLHCKISWCNFPIIMKLNQQFNGIYKNRSSMWSLIFFSLNYIHRYISKSHQKHKPLYN